MLASAIIDGREFFEIGTLEGEQALLAVEKLHGKRVLIQNAAGDRVPLAVTTRKIRFCGRISASGSEIA